MEKRVITAECEKLIASVLIPRFLPEIRPTEFNYPIAIYGKWHGNKYRFITRFRSDHPNSIDPSSRRRSRAWSMSAGTGSMCPTTGIRVNGFGSLRHFP